MILSCYFNEQNNTLIITSDNKVCETKVLEDCALFYNHDNKICGGNFCNTKIMKKGIVDIENLSDEIKMSFKENLNNYPFVYGYTKKVIPHPDSNKLQICDVDLGDSVVQIVCGASNCVQDKIVVVAKLGAVLPNGMAIRENKIRGIESNGMLCSLSELSKSNIKDVGIIILDDLELLGNKFV